VKGRLASAGLDLRRCVGGTDYAALESALHSILCDDGERDLSRLFKEHRLQVSHRRTAFLQRSRYCGNPVYPERPAVRY
jgi:hypothetical protein